MSAGWPAQINRQRLYPTSASMPAVLVAGPYYYAELAVSSPPVAHSAWPSLRG